MTAEQQIIEAIKGCYLEDGDKYGSITGDNQGEIDHAISLVKEFFAKMHTVNNILNWELTNKKRKIL